MTETARHIISRLSDGERAKVAEAARLHTGTDATDLLPTIFALLIPKYAGEVGRVPRKHEDRMVLACECAALFLEGPTP